MGNPTPSKTLRSGRDRPKQRISRQRISRQRIRMEIVGGPNAKIERSLPVLRVLIGVPFPTVASLRDYDGDDRAAERQMLSKFDKCFSKVTLQLQNSEQ